MGLNKTEELIADIKKGKMVLLMDDEDRENEAVSYTHLRAHET